MSTAERFARRAFHPDFAQCHQILIVIDIPSKWQMTAHHVSKLDGPWQKFFNDSSPAEAFYVTLLHHLVHWPVILDHYYSINATESQAMERILVYVTLCQFSFSPSPAVTIFTRFTSLTRLIGFSRLTSFSHKSTHNYPKTSLLMYNCTHLGLKWTLALVEPLSYTFLFQVPISPKFEANFWPDERLEQVKHQSCRSLDPTLPQANRRKRNPQSFGSNFKSPFNLQVLPMSTIEGLFSWNVQEILDNNFISETWNGSWVSESNYVYRFEVQIMCMLELDISGTGTTASWWSTWTEVEDESWYLGTSWETPEFSG